MHGKVLSALERKGMACESAEALSHERHRVLTLGAEIERGEQRLGVSTAWLTLGIPSRRRPAPEV